MKSRILNFYELLYTRNITLFLGFTYIYSAIISADLNDSSGATPFLPFFKVA